MCLPIVSFVHVVCAMVFYTVAQCRGLRSNEAIAEGKRSGQTAIINATLVREEGGRTLRLRTAIAVSKSSSHSSHLLVC
jgi:hypothetical protein